MVSCLKIRFFESGSDLDHGLLKGRTTRRALATTALGPGSLRSPSRARAALWGAGPGRGPNARVSAAPAVRGLARRPGPAAAAALRRLREGLRRVLPRPRPLLRLGRRRLLALLPRRQEVPPGAPSARSTPPAPPSLLPCPPLPPTLPPTKHRGLALGLGGLRWARGLSVSVLRGQNDQKNTVITAGHQA